MPNLKERRDELVKDARAVCAKATAEGRDLTAAEQKSVNDALTEIKSINEALVADARSKDILGQLDAMAGHADSGTGDQFLLQQGVGWRNSGRTCTSAQLSCGSWLTPCPTGWVSTISCSYRSR
jgi:hypothetical protein